ncbi:hypothetical protein QVD17_35513 [Tagetes erecta]|uniref:Remorin C-terminal domain-containing protein n=1 Tax=Tagetes erecta TaxID=13708 RepID=A0AAD8NLA7_TARER|nr:hypothetical protein QVD17_35513 [Tagetes erecta]
MENLIKQISMRIFQVEDDQHKAQASRVVKDRKISSRRTRSSKGDSRKTQNWGLRQLSQETSCENDKTEGEEFRTAVAAAAFAIISFENKEQEIKPEPNLNSKKSLSEIIEVPPRPKTSEELSSDANQQKPTVADMKTDEKVSVKTDGSKSSVEKTQCDVANKQCDSQTSKNEQEPELEPEPRLGELDIWEKTQMEKTKERFMKVKARIFDWENKKKSKAKNKLIRKEGKLELKRAQALQDFKRKTEMVEKISSGAISKAEKNQKREETRIQEKANMSRSTGRIQKPMFLCC